MSIVAAVEPRRWAEMRFEGVDHEHRIGRAINRIADEELLPFLNEAWRCFRSRAYNSALVWVWCALSRYLRAVVSMKEREVLFRFEYERLTGKRPGPMTQINDKELLGICRHIGVIGLDESDALGNWLEWLRDRRNALAHGDWGGTEPHGEATASEVVVAIERAVEEILMVSVAGQTFVTDADALRNFAKGMERSIPTQLVDELVRSVPERAKLINLCHQLLGSYRSGQDVVNLKNVRSVWTAAFQQLDSSLRASIILRGIEQVADVLDYDAIRSKSGTWTFEPRVPTEPSKDTDDPATVASQLLGLWREVSHELESDDIEALNRLREIQRQIDPLAAPFPGPSHGE